MEENVETPVEEPVETPVEETMEAPVDFEITDDDKLWALLSFIFPPLLGIIALLMEDKVKRPFIKYAAVLSIIMGVLSILLSWACIGLLVWIYSIYLGIKAYQGEWVTIPFVSDFVVQQKWASKP